MSASHIINLPNTPPITDDNDNPSAINPPAIAQQWLSSLVSVLRTNDFARLQEELFHPDSWWRDHLALQWDLRTIRGAEGIAAFLQEHQPTAQLSALKLQDEGRYRPSLHEPEKEAGLLLTWIVSMFFFETRVGRGVGVLRLTQENNSSNSTGKWKAYAVYTSLQELKGFEEPLGPRRVYGTLNSMPGGSSKGTWLERRKRQVEFVDEEPQVLVVGAGRHTLTSQSVSQDYSG